MVRSLGKVKQKSAPTGVCMQTPAESVATPINSGATPTFGVFLTANGTVPFDPTNNRIFVTFTDSTNTIQDETASIIDN
jgi:hypothetical protein